MCVIPVLSTVVTAVCMAECHTRGLPAILRCFSCLCAEHMFGLVREFPSFGGIFRPSTPFGHTWGWWGECLGKSQLVLEFKHPPFRRYCAFLLGLSQMVFTDTSSTCVFGGEGFGIDQPVRAASLAPHGHPYDVPEVSFSLR